MLNTFAMFYKSNILTGIPHYQLPQTVTLIYGTGQDAFDIQWIELRFFSNHQHQHPQKIFLNPPQQLKHNSLKHKNE